jgi:hypothetical protein
MAKQEQLLSHDEAWEESERIKQKIEDKEAKGYSEAEKELKLEDFPEKLKQLYNFTGPENGGFLVIALDRYESANRQTQENLIKFFTNESVINYIKLFSDNLRKRFETEGVKGEELQRWMAHHCAEIQMLVSKMAENEPDDLISMIEKTGMGEEGAIYNPEKYYDIMDIIQGQKLEGYNK